MKFKLKAILSMLLCVMLAGCSTSNSKFPGEFSYKSVKNVVGTQGTDSERSNVFNNIDELIRYSEEVFEGTVQDISYFNQGIDTYSKVLAKVNESYYGTLKKGDMVTIIEPGGYTKLCNYIKIVGKSRFQNVSDKDASNQYVKIQWEGRPLTQVGDKLLILGGYDKKGITGFSSDYLQLPGYMDGKFNIDDSSVERKSSDLSLDPLKMSKSEYKDIIKEHVKAIKK